ncbi:hypothetical protein BJY04DRAFT_214536 [Aspergillus karnatakaensis]|uniref:fungal specific transcription factor domain-containing protein n=1 Tax=Aspergillus karnatakaensis TaxID=1810916 RepID=UPI003CCD61AC
MARNACTECRNRKARNLVCSYAQPTSTFSQRDIVANPPPQGHASSEIDTGFQWGHQLSSNNSGLDIGTGTPSELLREGQLTQTLLLLYFQNFNDIHFMFDQTIFLRRFVLGDVPKVLLFAMMALGIRYSYAPFQSPHLRPHWGEPLYHQARQLLKEDFDHPSLTTIQVYVLLATYNLTFGGARKAWIFLNFARSFVNILKLDQPASDMDPVQAELCRRLIATIALMENTLPPLLSKVNSFPPINPIPQVYSEEEFDTIKNSASQNTNLGTMPCVLQEILTLSTIYHEACQIFETPHPERRNTFEQKLSTWQANIHPTLLFTPANLENHQQKFAIRPFTYMHLLHAHIWQLLLFDTMDWSSATLSRTTTPSSNDDNDYNTPLKIHTQASTVTSIIQQLWSLAQTDLHNACFGNILKTTQIILAHQLMSTNDTGIKTTVQAQLLILRDCLMRVKTHCRLFNWVFDQTEWFLRICSQSTFPPSFSNESSHESLLSVPVSSADDGEQWKSILKSQAMSLGTCYERIDYDTAGRSSGLESLADAESHEQHRRNMLPGILTAEFVVSR